MHVHAAAGAGMQAHACRRGAAARPQPAPAARHTQDASKDPESRSMIAAEVRSFMASTGSVQEADLFILQDRIRGRLAGDEPQ